MRSAAASFLLLVPPLFNGRLRYPRSAEAQHGQMDHGRRLEWMGREKSRGDGELREIGTRPEGYESLNAQGVT